MQEPFETLVVEVPTERVGPVMELVGNRRGLLAEMVPRGEYTFCRFEIPVPRTHWASHPYVERNAGDRHHQPSLLWLSADGSGSPPQKEPSPSLDGNGPRVLFALFNLQDRAELFIGPGEDVYEGMIVGENARDNDLVVNPIKEKKLTNIRAAGSDENVILNRLASCSSKPLWNTSRTTSWSK